MTSSLIWYPRFYRDDAGKHSLLEHGFSIEWAKRAGKLVCSELEEPVEENIVTFLNLALFWYSQGEWQKTFIYKCDSTHNLTLFVPLLTLIS